MPTPSERLRKILNERLPELLELLPWCKIEYKWELWNFSGKFKTTFSIYLWDKWGIIPYTAEYKVIWNEPQFIHLLRSLGEDYAIDGKGNIWKYVKEYKAWLSHSFEDATEFPVLDLTKLPCDQDPAKIEEIIKLFN